MIVFWHIIFQNSPTRSKCSGYLDFKSKNPVFAKSNRCLISTSFSSMRHRIRMYPARLSILASAFIFHKHSMSVCPSIETAAHRIFPSSGFILSYILAARTLGAKDSRLMFKHIFPNAIGTLITSAVLTIPSVIYSESNMTYLGIVNLDSSNMTSLGTMLSQGTSMLTTYPHIILFPAIYISLLMISFNLFGNGLRDAFNPSLRGTEE